MGDLTLPEYRALSEFRFQIRCFLQFSEHAARASGLEPQQHQLLLAIRGLPDGQEPTIRALAERLQIRHHSAVELVDRLERAGGVRRVSAGEDHRQVMVQLTRKGEQLLRKLSLAHREELDTAGPALARALEGVMRRRKAA